MSRILKDKRANRGDTRRESIVRAAREICLEKGFSKITVSDIASKVGMTRSMRSSPSSRNGTRPAKSAT